ncbi:MAG: hypothetical protein A3B37_00660 [Candidatus Sungbacteria bacterium RIFCSPLOWO2_01_FULL_59_16]|uniref:HTH deoR-type domain-containing protein n=1 Tax=Candidatus Sungbacteria bacterium RIFCSPLOWO2_01_FULL_59_16 TaxID=1802280 RepID=A0A1G2LB34_9BACT|nr:MAG: hypothetical protein A3B37_00660 [Candidatus Sungbacteria bacterium RIFCSPLOWO2_01_FULL_59_16]
MPPEEADKAPLPSPEPPLPSEAGAAETAAPEALPSEAQAPETPPPAAEQPLPPPEPPPAEPQAPSQLPAAARPAIDYPAIGRQTRIQKREARLEKLLAYAREKGRITNDEIQKLLRVSEATASRYACELVRRGLLSKAGKGRAAYYGLR